MNCSLGIIRRTVLALLVLSNPVYAAGQQTGLKVGDKFPAISLEDLGGKQVSLPASADGSIFIAHFWAIWCPYCVEEIADLQSIQTAYGGKGVRCYSINAGDSAEAARTYIKKSKATYTIMLDPKQSTSKGIGVKSIPTTFICDRKGTIRYKILGEVSRKKLEKLLSTIP